MKPRTRSIPPRRKLVALAGLGGRTALAHQARGVQAALESDLGGADNLSTAQRILVQKAAALNAFTCWCEATWLTGDEPMDPSYLGAVATLSRLLAQIGIQRVARDVTPTLTEYLASKSAQ